MQLRLVNQLPIQNIVILSDGPPSKVPNDKLSIFENIFEFCLSFNETISTEKRVPISRLDPYLWSKIRVMGGYKVIIVNVNKLL